MAAKAAVFALAKAFFATLLSVPQTRGDQQPPCQGLALAAAPLAAGFAGCGARIAGPPGRTGRGSAGGVGMQGVGRVTGGGAVARGSGGGRAGFAVRPEAPPPGMQGMAATGAVSPLALGMLGLQEGGERERRDTAARRRAESMLDALRALQAEMLGGGAPDPARLARLAALESGEEGMDPALREAVQAVALRARVELARRGWDISASPR
jgi:hypothetical protein